MADLDKRVAERLSDQLNRNLYGDDAPPLGIGLAAALHLPEGYDRPATFWERLRYCWDVMRGNSEIG